LNRLSTGAQAREEGRGDRGSTLGPGVVAAVAVVIDDMMHCPSLNIFGTFFPSWMLCAILGIIAAAIAYAVLSHTRLGSEIRPALLAYPSFALCVTFVLWLSLYGQ
jgi:hypothetical protein